MNFGSGDLVARGADRIGWQLTLGDKKVFAREPLARGREVPHFLPATEV